VASVKYKVVSLLPNLPGGNDEGLHKKGIVMLDLGLLHHLEEIHCEFPIYTKVLPTGLAKGAAEEQMKCCFFNAVAA
jgi:hypothetical protein